LANVSGLLAGSERWYDLPKQTTEVTEAMPTVLRSGPYRFFFFSNEGQEPPHVHVQAGDEQAKIWLDPVEVAVNYGLLGSELNEIQRLVEVHREDLLEAWHEHFET
jgi:hypothetical protein